MAKLTTQQTSILANVALMSAIFVAGYFDIAFIQWLVVSLIWLMLSTYLIVLIDSDKSAISRILESGHKLNTYFAWLVDLACFSTLIYFSWYLTAGAYAVSCVVLQAIYTHKNSTT